MECDKITPKTISTELVDVKGNKIRATQRQLTMGEIWAAEELSGAKAGRFDPARLRAFLSDAGKTKYSELTPDEAVALFSSDAWIKGDDNSTPAGRRQTLYQVAFSLGLMVQGRGGGSLGLGEGLGGVSEITAEALVYLFDEPNFVKLLEGMTKLATLSEPELKN